MSDLGHEDGMRTSYVGSDRQELNDLSLDHAEHHKEPWSQGHDELLQLWDGRSEEDLLDLSIMLGRTIEACRQRYYIVMRASSVTYHTRTTTVTAEGVTTSHSTVTRRPKWMDDENLPDWYV